MFLVVQHPFADVRRFVGESGRLTTPAWPLVNLESDFLRSAGKVRPRLKGGLDDWDGEEVYCDAGMAIRFENRLNRRALQVDQYSAQIARTFRRYNSIGTVSRLEVGFKIKLKDFRYGRDTLNVASILKECLSLPVRIGSVGHRNRTLPVSMAKCGAQLASHFLKATTKREGNAARKTESWWFSSGVPTVILEYDLNSPIAMPLHSRRIEFDGAPSTLSNLSFAWMELDEQRFGAWFVKRGLEGPDQMRRLRLHLLRLHAERECLRLVLSHLASGKLDLGISIVLSDNVQQYLNDTLRSIDSNYRYGVDQQSLVNAALHAMDSVAVGQSASLRSVRRQVLAKVENYIRRTDRPATIINQIQGNQMNTNIKLGNVTVSGDFNVVTANSIENSFNKVASSTASEDIREALKILTQQVAELAKQLPTEKAEEVAKDLSILAQEAISDKPRKAWYELSSNGLLEAAKTVAEMAAPVSAAVASVLALIA